MCQPVVGAIQSKYCNSSYSSNAVLLGLCDSESCFDLPATTQSSGIFTEVSCLLIVLLERGIEIRNDLCHYLDDITLFLFFDDVFWVKKLSIMMKYHLSIFDIMNCAFGIISKNFCLTQDHEYFLISFLLNNL